MPRVPTRDLKNAYRKAIAGYQRETDPLRKSMYLRASFAIKVDLASRIKFRSNKKFNLWKHTVRIFALASALSDPLDKRRGGTLSVTKEDSTNEKDTFSNSSRSSTRRVLPEHWIQNPKE